MSGYAYNEFIPINPEMSYNSVNSANSSNPEIAFNSMNTGSSIYSVNQFTSSATANAMAAIQDSGPSTAVNRTTLKTKSPKSKSKKKPIKKRKRNEDNWKKTVRKRARNSGEAYLTGKGKEVAKKEFKNVSCKCRKKCNEKFTEDERKQFFDSFWKLADFSKQNVYLWGCVMPQDVARRRPRNGTGKDKSVTFSYTLRNGRKTKTVCRKYFVDTFQIDQGRVYRCVSKPEVHTVVDSRGRKTPNKKIDTLELVAESAASDKKKIIPTESISVQV